MQREQVGECGLELGVFDFEPPQLPRHPPNGRLAPRGGPRGSDTGAGTPYGGLEPGHLELPVFKLPGGLGRIALGGLQLGFLRREVLCHRREHLLEHVKQLRLSSQNQRAVLGLAAVPGKEGSGGVLGGTLVVAACAASPSSFSTIASHSRSRAA